MGYTLVKPSTLYSPGLAGNTDSSLPLPGGLILPEDPFDVRSTITALSLTDGAVITGGQAESRELTLSGTILYQDTTKTQAQNRAAAMTALGQLRAFAAQPDLCLVVSEEGSFCNLRILKSFMPKFTPMWDRCAIDLEIVWSMGDPFWYALGQQVESQSFTGDGSLTFTVDSLWPVSPIITVTGDPGFTIGAFTLENATDSLSLRYANLWLNGSETLVLDCRLGTATEQGLNGIQYVQGEWLRLLTGSNTINWHGTNATVQIQWFNKL